MYEVNSSYALPTAGLPMRPMPVDTATTAMHIHRFCKAFLLFLLRTWKCQQNAFVLLSVSLTACRLLESCRLHLYPCSGAVYPFVSSGRAALLASTVDQTTISGWRSVAVATRRVPQSRGLDIQVVAAAVLLSGVCGSMFDCSLRGMLQDEMIVVTAFD